MGFDFGAFAGGVGQGISQGQDIRERYRKMVDEQRVRKANQLAAAVLAGQSGASQLAAGGGAGPMPGMPTKPGVGGPPPMGAPGPQPGPMPPQGAPGPMPGATPPQAGPTPVPMPGARPMTPPQPMGQNPAPGGPPPAPGPMAQPMTKPGAGGAPGPGAMPPGGGASPDPNSPFAGLDIKQLGSQYQQLQQISEQHYKDVLQQVVQHMKQSGQKVDPLEAMQAADAIIAKQDLDPTLKSLITAQAGMAKSQMNFVLGQGRLEESTRQHDLQHEDRQAATDQRAQAANLQHMDRQQRNQYYGEFVTFSHEDRQAAIQAANDRNDKNNATKLQALDTAIQDRDWQTVARITAQQDVAETGAASREYGADVGMGAKRPLPKPVRTPLPAKGGGGQAAGSYRSAQDVAAAYKAGKLSRDKAEAILRQNGWAQ